MTQVESDQAGIDRFGHELTEEDPRRRYRWAVLIGFVAIVLLLLTLFSCESRSRGDLHGPGSAEVNDVAFTIGGDSTKPITPGQMVTIDLEVTNPHDVAMVVTDFSVSMQGVSAPRATQAHPCSLADFVVQQPAGALRATVSAGATSALSGLGVDSELWPRVGMLNRPVNQDGCKGASLTLVYSGSGTLTS